MYELIILGLLQKEELNGYQIKQKAGLYFSTFLNLSFGSLYPQLKKLENKKFIQSKTNYTEGGQEKITYTLTQEGKNHFDKLVVLPLSQNYSSAITNFYIVFSFFKFINGPDQKFIINQMIELTETELNKIQNNQENLNLDQFQLLLKNKTIEELKNNKLWLQSLQR